jgi:predicted RecA/RadA family phage recombinase
MFAMLCMALLCCGVSFALSANADRDRYVDQELRAYALDAAVHPYKGSLLGINPATGLARALVAGDEFCGVAYEEVDNSAGAASAKSIRAYTEGDFEFPLAGAAAANNGKAIYASADDTISTNAVIGTSFVGVQIAVARANVIILRIKPFSSPPVPVV